MVLTRTNQRIQQSGARARKYTRSHDDPLSSDEKKVCKESSADRMIIISQKLVQSVIVSCMTLKIGYEMLH